MGILVFEPVVPMRWLVAGWIALPILVAAYALWRPPQERILKRWILAVGHAVPVAGLLFLLHGPTWLSMQSQDGERPPFLILIDRSASMSAEAAGDHPDSRFSQAVRLAQKNADRWNRSLSMRWALFDRTVAPVSTLDSTATPDGGLTDLARAIDDGIAGGSPPAGILLISDGIHNGQDDPRESARRARALGCPIYTVTLGSDAAVQDLGLLLAESEGLTFIRQPYRLLATLTHRGLKNTQVKVTLRQGERVVQERSVALQGAEDIGLDFLITQEKAGVYEYTLAVEERPGEFFRSNNRQRLMLRVVDERIRVLLIEGKPYWDSKFLLQALRRDRNVAVTALTRVSAGKVLHDAPADGPSKGLVPKNLASPLEDLSFLDVHQIVIFGRDVETLLTPAAVANLKTWISQRGGHLICSRGRPVSARANQEDLLSLVPIVWAPDEEKRFRIELTERGKMTALFSSSRKDQPAGEEDPRVVLRALPTLVTASRIEKERALAVVLARASGAGNVADMATLTYQQYGAGRVVVVEGQGLWHWAFQPSDSPAAQHSIFEAFWSNTVRWLIGSNEFLPSQLLTMRVGKSVYTLDERPVIYVMERSGKAGAEDAPTLEIRPDGDVAPEAASAWPLKLQPMPVPGDATLRRAVLDPLPEGRYRVKLLVPNLAAEAVFEVIPPLQERLDLRSRHELMKRLSDISDGQALTPEEASQLVERYGQYVSRFRPDMEKRTPAWDSPWIWAIGMAWFAMLWYVRRRWAMI